MSLKTIYFDLGNVLLFFSYPRMFEQLGKCCGLPPQELKRELLEGSLQMQYEAGKIGGEEVYRALKKRAKRAFSKEEFFFAISDIFVPNEELWALVEKLKQKGFRLLLLSNTNEAHFAYASAHYPILDLFDETILSYKVGALKPDPRIYDYALSLAKCKKQECFYTDDIEEFVQSARRCGLDSEVFTGVPDFRRHLLERGVVV